MKFYAHLLTEAELKDIYPKFYSKDLTEDDFYTVVHADPTYDVNKPQKMGKYGKWLLNNVKSGKLKMEDLYKATESLYAFNKFNSKLEVKDISKYKTPDDLYNAVKQYINSYEPVSNKERKHAGVEHVYEDDEWLIVIPKTHEASVYYGRGTRWCTAAKDNDKHFNSYVADGPLYINIRKEDGAKFQFHFPSQSYMNAEDEFIWGCIDDEIGLNDDVLDFYESIDKSYRDELTRERIDEDPEPEVEVLLETDRVRVTYVEDNSDINIYYPQDDEEYYVSIYNGNLYNALTGNQIKDPIADVLSPDVISIIKEYLTDDEFYNLVFANYFIDDIDASYYPLCEDYVLCYLNDNDEAVLYFCDSKTYKSEVVINFKDSDMSLVNVIRRENLIGQKFLIFEDEYGLMNVYNIKKEKFVFNKGFHNVHSQKRENVVFGFPGGIDEPIIINIDDKEYKIPQNDDRLAVNAEYSDVLNCILINSGNDIKDKDIITKTYRFSVYSLNSNRYLTDEIYSSLTIVRDNNKPVGWAMERASDKKIPYKYDTDIDDMKTLSEYEQSFGSIVLLNPDSDAVVILADDVVMTRTEYMKKIDVYEIAKSVYNQIF